MSLHAHHPSGSSSLSPGIKGLVWKLCGTPPNNDISGIVRIHVKSAHEIDAHEQSLQNPLNSPHHKRLVSAYGNGESFQNNFVNVNVPSSEFLGQTIKLVSPHGTTPSTKTKQTPGNKHLVQTLKNYQSFLNNNPLTQTINASTSSMLLKTNDDSNDLIKAEGDVVAKSLFQNNKCSGGNSLCFFRAREKISDLGALFLRNLFAHLCQNEDFVREHISDYTVNENLKCAIWRVCMSLENMDEIAKALDESLVMPTAASSRFYQDTFRNMAGEKAKWVFIVTAYRSSGANGGRGVKLFVSFVNDLATEYSENIAPLFSFIDGSFFVGYLNPNPKNHILLKSSQKGTYYSRRFIGGTPFTVPPMQKFLGAVSLDGYAKKQQKPKVSSSFSESVWNNGSKKSRLAAMHHWVTIVKKAGFINVEVLGAMPIENVYEKLHPHIKINEGECRYPLCSDTLTVLGFAGSTSHAPNTSEMTGIILKDLLSYFIGPKQDLADYFFELEGKSASSPRVMKNASQIPFTNMLLVDLMIATHIFLCKSRLEFMHRDVAGQAVKIFGAQDPQALVRAYAATLSIPAFDVDITSPEDLVMMIRTYDDNVLAPVAGYVANRDSVLRQNLDKLRVELYRMGFSVYSNSKQRLHYKEKELFLSLFVPDVLGKRGYGTINDVVNNGSVNMDSTSPTIGTDSDSDDEGDDEDKDNNNNDNNKKNPKNVFFKSDDSHLTKQQKTFIYKFLDRINHSWFPYCSKTDVNVSWPTNPDSYTYENTIGDTLHFIQEIRTFKVLDNKHDTRIHLFEKIEKLKLFIFNLFKEQHVIRKFVLDVLAKIFQTNLDGCEDVNQLHNLVREFNIIFETALSSRNSSFSEYLEKLRNTNGGLINTFFRVTQETKTNTQKPLLDAILFSVRANRYNDDDEYKNSSEVTLNAYAAESMTNLGLETTMQKALVHFLMKFKNQFQQPSKYVDKQGLELEEIVSVLSLNPASNFDQNIFDQAFENYLYFRFHYNQSLGSGHDRNRNTNFENLDINIHFDAAEFKKSMETIVKNFSNAIRSMLLDVKSTDKLYSIEISERLDLANVIIKFINLLVYIHPGYFNDVYKYRSELRSEFISKLGNPSEELNNLPLYNVVQEVFVSTNFLGGHEERPIFQKFHIKS